MTLVRFTRYNVVSGAGVGVQLSAIWILDRITPLPIVIVTALAVATALVHNFAWHWRWTWADPRRRRRDLPASLARFALANGLVSVSGNLVVMSILADGAGWSPLIANGAAIALCGLVNFLIADNLVFARRQRARRG